MRGKSPTPATRGAGWVFNGASPGSRWMTALPLRFRLPADLHRFVVGLGWLLTSSLLAAQTVPLEGTWELCRSSASVLPGDATWQAVQVPSFQSQDSHRPFLWYRRKFTVPGEFAGRHLFLRFEGVRFVSEIAVDGKTVGGHRGGWEPFEIDVTSACSPGREHSLVVRVQDLTGLCDPALSDTEVRRGERLIDQAKDSVRAPVGSQYTRVGIWQSVSLLARDGLYVEDVFVKTSLRRKQISVEVAVRNLGDQPRTANCAVAVESGVAFQPVAVAVPEGASRTVTVTAPWADPRLWRPEDPHLYRLSTQLESNGRVTDCKVTRFGFREFWTDGPRLILNGTPMNFLATAGHPRGDLNGELSKQGAFDLFRRIREAGCVAMRLHANVWPGDWYDAADEAGMPVILESALFCYASAYAMSQDDFWKSYHEHLSAVIRAHRNHPSIVMISLENEILHCGGERCSPECEHRLAEAGRMVKALDPTRPILYDGDDDPEGVADVINLHYPLDFNRQNLWPDVAYWLETGMEVACYPKRFWTWDRKKPLYLGEFLHLQHFNEADPYSVLLGDDAYRGHADAMAQAKALAWEMQTEAYRADGLSGMCPWTLLESGPFPSENNPRYLAVKRAYEKNAAFVRQYDKRFYAGEKVARTISLHNDTPAKARLECLWQLSDPQEVVDQGGESFELEPAAARRFELHLSIPPVQEETRLTFGLRVRQGDKDVFARSWPYRAYPRRPLAVPKGLQLAVLGKLPPNLESSLKGSGAVLTDLPSLAGLPPEGVVLVAPHALDQTGTIGSPRAAGEGSPLESFVARGGSVMVLEQDRYPDVIPAQLADRACTIAFRRSQDEHLMAGLAEDDFRFWRGDHVVARKTIEKPVSGRFRALVDSGGPGGLVYLPWLEIASGRGRYLLCQLLIAEKFGHEPVAQRVLENLLACAAQPLANPSRVAVLQDKLPLTGALAEIDAKATDLSGRIKDADLSPFHVFLIETDAPDTAACQAKIAEWVRAGGRAILHGGTPAGLACLNQLLPEPMSLQRESMLPVNLLRWDRTIDGLTNQELYWYGSRKDLGHRELTPLSSEVVHYSVVPGLPEAPAWKLVKPEAFVPQTGKVSLRDDSLYMGSLASVETDVEFARSGPYALGLLLKGTPLGGIFPLVDVLIDGRRCASLSAQGISWSFAWCSVGVEAGRRRVGLRFANDEYDPEHHEDRNLWIKQLQTVPTRDLRADKLIAPAALVQASLGKGTILIDQVRWDAKIGSDQSKRYLSTLLTNLGADFGSSSQGLRIAGERFSAVKPSPGLRFADGKAYLGTNGRVIAKVKFATTRSYEFRVRASGTPAEGVFPHLALSIDGKAVSGATLARGEWHTLPMEAAVSAGEHEVGLALTNDLYRPPEDRNLRVEWLEIR